jgi:hypothetical protein
MIEEFEDLIRTCVDCDCQYTWTAGQQAYFRDNSLVPPKRCAECRRIVRERHAAAVTDGRR